MERMVASECPYVCAIEQVCYDTRARESCVTVRVVDAIGVSQR